ncbi:MAG TPA: hypothetical protein VHZ06_04825 [Marmoricola sp.]|nr:hypothetical protein [Marmoricola sp.]
MSQDLRVVLLAPHRGASGVGDYASDFAAAIAPSVREVVEFRHAAPRTASAREIRSEVRRLRALVTELRRSPGPVVVHAELSGGAVTAFWGVRALQRDGVRVTATLHDPPRAVWYPFLTRGVSRGRVLNQAIHRPLHWALEPLERRTLAEVDLFVLTEPGAAATRRLRIGRSVTTVRHTRPVSVTAATTMPPPVTERPAAVGLFGHVYTGKGFDLLPDLRRRLPADIALRVAGRGTETLRPVPGVEVLGPLEADGVAGFFGSIRALLLPYDRPSVGGHEMLPCSGTHELAVALGTPTVALRSTMTEYLATDDLTLLADGGAAGLADAAAALVTDPAELDRFAAVLARHRELRSEEDTAEPFLAVWSR